MTLYAGNCEVVDLFAGDCPVIQRYVGDCLVWSALEPALEPVFWANGYDPVTFEMLGVKTGVGRLTEARAYQIEVPDYQGVYVSVPGGQPAWDGARWDDGVAYADNGSGVLLDPLPRLVHAPQATNIFTNSRDFTEWSGSAVITPVAGIDGTSQQIHITDNNSSSDVYMINTFSGAVAGEPLTVNFMVKKEAATFYPYFLLAPVAFDINFMVAATLNQETGEAVIRSDAVNGQVSVTDSGNYWTLSMSVSSAQSAVDYSVRVYPARFAILSAETSDVVVSATGGIDCDAMCVYPSTEFDVCASLPPIYTTSYAVTRDACALSYDTANHDDTAGAYLIEIDHGPDGQMLLSEFLRVLGADMRLTDGVNVADVASAAGQHTVDITYGDGSMQLTVDDVESGAQTYDGSLLVGALDLFRGSPNVGYVGEIKRYGESNVPTPNYDYVIALTGDDTNPGTAAQPWRHLSKIKPTIVQQGEVVSVLVEAGTYDSGDADTVELTGSGTYSEGTLLEITFEAGCVIDGTLVTEAVTNCFEIGDGNLPVTVYGNGVALREFNISSANLVGTRDSVIVNLYDLDFFSGQDGISGHATETVNVYNCIFRQGVVRPVVNVGSSIVNLTNCDVFGLVSYGASASGTLHRCRFTPSYSGQFFHGPMTITQSIVGTNVRAYEFTPAAGFSGTETMFVEDSYICLYQDDSTPTMRLELTRCFGRLGARARPSMLTLSHCCITANAGTTGIPTSTSDPGSVGQYLIQNNIFGGTAGLADVPTYVGDYMEASGSLIQNNIRLPSQSWDGIPAAILSGDLTSDPEITAVDGSSYDMADYAFAVGSPAEGAGLGGTDIGFSSAEVVPVGPEWL